MSAEQLSERLVSLKSPELPAIRAGRCRIREKLFAALDPITVVASGPQSTVVTSHEQVVVYSFERRTWMEFPKVPQRGACRFVEGEPRDAVRQLVGLLRNESKVV